MKISLAWLKEWVVLPPDPMQLSKLLTMAGFEVETVVAGLDQDLIVEVNIPPNRGDCLSVYGLAREIALLQGKEVTLPTEIKKLAYDATLPINVSQAIDMPITVLEEKACPYYSGRIIEGIDNRLTTPIWLKKRLIASGITSINPVVDITNYVMLEVGQPLHAFDLAQLQSEIQIRYAKPQETLLLLNSKTVTLSSDTLVIADSQKAQAIAGVMGSLTSSVTTETKSIFLECASFLSPIIVGKARSYGLQSDAAFRFERGVAPHLIELALARATSLLLEIIGGCASPVIKNISQDFSNAMPAIHLRYKQIGRILGITLPNEAVENILQRLGCKTKPNSDGWDVIPPCYRFDINLEIDLIEEIARLQGYHHIPVRYPYAEVKLQPFEKSIPFLDIAQCLINRGYFEAITYSFVDEVIQNLIDPDHAPLRLINPISPEMAVMRTQLWPGLLKAASYNQSRKQIRLRLFEIGLCFLQQETQLIQEERIAGLAIGNVYPEQWGIAPKPVDFYDVKADLQALFGLTGAIDSFRFVPCQHPGLHPGIASQILYRDIPIGYLGCLHPQVQEKLELQGPIYLFEVSVAGLTDKKLPKAIIPSKFPAIRRDLALLIDQQIPIQQVLDVIKKSAGKLLQHIQIFDLYQGKNIPDGKKSIAVGLIVQHPNRTLNDEEVNDLIKRVMALLKETYNISLRE